MSTLQEFTQAAALRTVDVEIAPGVTVKLRELTLAQRVKLGNEIKANPEKDANGLTLIACAVEPELPADFDFSNIRADIYAKLVQAAAEVNGLVGKD